MTEPQYFGVLDYVELGGVDLDGFNYLTTFRGGLHIVTFSIKDLANPSTEPIGLFYVNGTRRYVWRSRFWADYDVPSGPLIASINLKLQNIKDTKTTLVLRRALDILKEYRIDAGPSPDDHIDNQTNQRRIFSRVLYEINQ